jgi:DNA-binding NtrC family response regulator
MTTEPPPVANVLCVDDDADLLATVARILRLDGYRVLTADSPRGALAILAAQPIAVLVSDYEMPEMTGIELAVRARALQPETVRIMLTGRSTLDTAIDGINIAEVFRFLSKPFSPEMLRVEVAAAVTHHREISAVVRERMTVVRRQRLTEALEADHPGITVVPRDEAGAYLLDGDARHAAPAELVPILALLERQP